MSRAGRPARGRGLRAWLGPAWLAAVACAGVGLAGCDGATSHGRRPIATGPLVVYSSGPLLGPSAASGRAVLEGERTALAAAHGRVGRYRIVLRSLDDATRRSDGADPGQTSADALLAARDPRTIGYLGDLNSGATAISLPVLNRADIPQISPLSTALGLTRGGPAAAPGEPEKYYPANTRTFARVVPNDAVQAAVQVRLQQAAGCRRDYLVYDDEVEGRDAAVAFAYAARRAGIAVPGFDQFVSGSARGAAAGIAARVAAARPGCVLVSALLQDGAVDVVDALARALPRVRLYLTAPLAVAAFVDPTLGGVPLALDRRLVLTYPTLALPDYPARGRRFLRGFDRRYGGGAEDGIWGDAAMSLMLSAIRRASHDGRRAVTRRAVTAAIFATRGLPSVLGTYSITPPGDTTLRRFGVYRAVDGRLVFWKALAG